MPANLNAVAKFLFCFGAVLLALAGCKGRSTSDGPYELVNLYAVSRARISEFVEMGEPYAFVGHVRTENSKFILLNDFGELLFEIRVDGAGLSTCLDTVSSAPQTRTAVILARYVEEGVVGDIWAIEVQEMGVPLMTCSAIEGVVNGAD